MKIANDILIPELARLLAEGKEVRFTPSGVSMRPFIEGDCDSVVLSPIVSQPRVGDILLVRIENKSQISNPNSQLSNPTYVLHRLIRIEGETFVLQGDGNLMGEETCTREGLIGRVTAIESPAGHRKPLTRGRLWHRLFPVRRWLLKIYRHSLLKWCY
ncbi:MAG: S24/S26 family peptidase [Paludibacteraceae bacterium]|nr:S24/S26 family peptidase [Paludibacteraceae bacterium]